MQIKSLVILCLGFTVMAMSGYSSVVYRLDNGTLIQFNSGPSNHGPTVVGAGNHWLDHAFGHQHHLAIDEHGELYSWGDNHFGQLGRSGNLHLPELISFSASGQVVRCFAGAFHSFALDASGNAFAWGRNTFGQLGDGTTTSRSQPVPVLSHEPLTEIAAGADHSLALGVSGNLYIFGSHGFQQTQSPQSHQPTPIGAPGQWQHVSAGDFHSAAVDINGELHLWGKNSKGQTTAMGTPSIAFPNTAGQGNWMSVHMGNDYSLALDVGGNLMARGDQSYGALGLTNANSASTDLVAVQEHYDWKSIQAGRFHALGMSSSGNLYGWGDNRNGWLTGSNHTIQSNPHLLWEAEPWSNSLLYDYQLPLVDLKTTYISDNLIDAVKESDNIIFQPNYHSFTSIDANVNVINVGSYALFWGNDMTGLASHNSGTTANTLIQLVSDNALRQTVTDTFQAMLDNLRTEHGVDISPSVSPEDGLNYRTAIYFTGTGMWPEDTAPVSGGGTRVRGWNEDTTNTVDTPIIEVHGGILANLATGNDDYSTLMHEMIHTMQAFDQRDNFDGWAWYIEGMASYFSNEYFNSNIFSMEFENRRHIPIDDMALRYATTPFWLSLRHEFGSSYVGDILMRKVNPGESLLEFLARIAPFDNPEHERRAAFANAMGRFAAGSINYVGVSQDEGVDTLAQLYHVDRRLRESVDLLHLGDRRYRVADALAPGRFGRNFIQLIRDPNRDVIEIEFDGWDIPERQSEFRVTLVATLDEQATPRSEVWGEMFKGGTQVINIKNWEAQLGQSIQTLTLAIIATPLQWMEQDRLAGLSEVEQRRILDRYVYEVGIKGAWPQGHEPQHLRTPENVSGSAHPNGGGFVADTATVASSAYVGPEARVLGQAQVLDSARVEGRAIVHGSAIVRNNAVISGRSEIFDTATLSGNAAIRDSNLVQYSAHITDNSLIVGNSIYYNNFTTTQHAVVMGAPHLWNVGESQGVSGEAVVDGTKWFGTSANVGVPSNDWSISANGLFAHFNFEEQHPYRVRDQHATSDAYILSAQGQPYGSLPQIFDATLSSNTLNLQSGLHLDLPRHLLDFQNLIVEVYIKWNGNTQEPLLTAQTDLGEMLHISLLPGSVGSLDVQCSLTDRLGQMSSTTLADAALQTATWTKLQLKFDGDSDMMSLEAFDLNDNSLHSSSANMGLRLRDLNMDTLTFQLGSAAHSGNTLNAQIDDLKFIRY